jgi:prevent-host-death family protein
MVILYKMGILDGGGAAMADPIEIPASEVRERISDVISRVAYGGERVIISRNGKPQVALISIADYERLKEQEARIRKRAVEAVDSIRAEAQRLGLDKLSDEEIDEIIAETRRERRSRGEE